MFSQDMYQLGVKRSCIRDVFEYGLQLKKKLGEENVYDYSLGNPSVPAPAAVNDTIIKLVQTENSLKLHGYSSAAGFADVKEAVAKELGERFGWEATPDEFFFTCGAAPALTAVIRALSVPDSEIMAIYPCFAEYKVFVESNGSKFVPVPADEENFLIRFDLLESMMNPHTQAVIINSPNNPSGVVYSKETVEQLAEVLTRKSREYGHPVYLISDEPYRELVYDGVKIPFVPAIYRNTIICYSYSKSLSLPGERIGYIYISKNADDGRELLAAAGGAARAMGHVCPPSLMQKVIGCNTYTRPDLEAYDRNRTTLYEALTSYGYECPKPQGAFYIFIKAPGGNSEEFAAKAREKNLLLVPGNDFGCPGYFRICTCVAHDMILRSLPAFKAVIEAYK